MASALRERKRFLALGHEPEQTSQIMGRRRAVDVMSCCLTLRSTVQYLPKPKQLRDIDYSTYSNIDIVADHSQHYPVQSPCGLKLTLFLSEVSTVCVGSVTVFLLEDSGIDWCSVSLNEGEVIPR
jgi:hypothetical protein